MAAHSLTIAKAAFAAGCLGSGEPKVSREDLSTFHALFEEVVAKCSTLSVQKCKQWLDEYLLSSPSRCAALGKYLAAYSRQMSGTSQTVPEGSVRCSRQRLHIIYLLSDVLHHAKYHSTKFQHLEEISGKIGPQTLELFRLALYEASTKVRTRLMKILQIWKEEQYFGEDLLDQITQTFSVPRHVAAAGTVSTTVAVPARDIPYTMPATHGDPDTPYYDLPAANLMPHIIPNLSTPMRTSQIRALQLSKGAVDEGLISAVKDFLKEVDMIDHPFALVDDPTTLADIDELGQSSYRNEADDLVVETYYGWSREFCEKMKRRGQPRTIRSNRSFASSLSRSRSGSPSMDSRNNRSHPKRRRYTSDSSEGEGGRARSRHRSRSRHASGSESPQRYPIYAKDQQSATKLYQPQQQFAPVPLPGTLDLSQPPPAPYSLTFNNLPLPIPRPPNWTGPWPPPLPPFPTGMASNMPFMAPLPPPPHPPPPPPPF